MNTERPEPKQRSAPRFPVNGNPIRIYRIDGSNSVFDATCKDIAVGGLGANLDRISAPGQLFVGEIIEIEFLNREVDKFSARHQARVVYHNSDEYGFEFLDLLGTCIPE